MTREQKIRVLKDIQAGKAAINELRPIGCLMWESVANQPGMYTLANPDGSYTVAVPYEALHEYAEAKGYHPKTIHITPDHRSSPHLWDTAVELSTATE